jgi:hypothetical protein
MLNHRILDSCTLTLRALYHPIVEGNIIKEEAHSFCCRLWAKTTTIDPSSLSLTLSSLCYEAGTCSPMFDFRYSSRGAGVDSNHMRQQEKTWQSSVLLFRERHLLRKAHPSQTLLPSRSRPPATCVILYFSFHLSTPRASCKPFGAVFSLLNWLACTGHAPPPPGQHPQLVCMAAVPPTCWAGRVCTAGQYTHTHCPFKGEGNLRANLLYTHNTPPHQDIANQSYRPPCTGTVPAPAIEK